MERHKGLAPLAELVADTTVDQVTRDLATRAERRFYDLVAKMFVTWRTDLGLSRERMAVLLGVDDAIVRRAECATSRVTIWFIRIMLAASGETWEQFGERMQRVDPIIALAAPIDVTLLDAQRRTYEALRLNPSTGKPKRAARRRHVEQVMPAQPDHLVGPLYRKAIDCLHEVCVRRLREVPEWRIGAASLTLIPRRRLHDITRPRSAIYRAGSSRGGDEARDDRGLAPRVEPTQV